MDSQQQTHTTATSSVGSLALLYGALGFVVAAVLSLVGLLGRGDQYILSLLHVPVFQGEVTNVIGLPVLALVTGFICFGVAFAVLDSPRAWRRVILGFTVIVLVAALVPTFAVWNIYFPPLMSLIGVFWAWFSSMMYANHHCMPCDQVLVQPVTAASAPITLAAPSISVSVEEDSPEVEQKLTYAERLSARREAKQLVQEKALKLKTAIPASALVEDPYEKYKPKTE